MSAAQKMLVGSASEHAELGRDYLRANMPGFALKHLREAVTRLEQAADLAVADDGGTKLIEQEVNSQGLIEL
jgi:DNA-binding IclR family transcriptional regulator